MPVLLGHFVRHKAAGTAALSMLGAIVFLAMPFSIVDRMIFQPTSGVDLLPEDLGVEGQEVFFETEDGVRIHAFFLPAPGATRALLFLHGNAGNASHRLPNAAELVRLGAHVLLLEYRGYGRSEGRASEAGVYADARAGLAHLTIERGIPEDRILVFGRSLGGAVAVDLARDRNLAGLVLESTFTSVSDMVRAMFGLPLRWLTRGSFDSRSKIGSVRCPILFFHGDHDSVVPIALGRALHRAAPEPKAFEVLVGADHNDTTQVGGRAYFERLGRFLDQVAPQAPIFSSR